MRLVAFYRGPRDGKKTPLRSWGSFSRFNCNGCRKGLQRTVNGFYLPIPIFLTSRSKHLAGGNTMLAIIFILQARKIIILPARPPAGESRGRSLEVLERLRERTLRRLQRMREKSRFYCNGCGKKLQRMRERTATDAGKIIPTIPFLVENRGGWHTGIHP